ncbi:MAG: hypothetical protein K8R77_14600 [Anaerolineaceae bacterium]|nr:hypothetical protein [Anaerolineaceae bacterium]
MIEKKRIKVIGGLAVLLVLLMACNLPWDSNNEVDVSVALTQTFAAVATEIEGTRVAMQGTGEDVAEPTAPAEEVSPAEDAVPSETPQPTATIVHLTQPGEFPGGRESGMTDPDSSSTAGQNRASRGENFAVNLFERPFSAEGWSIIRIWILPLLPSIAAVTGSMSRSPCTVPGMVD